MQKRFSLSLILLAICLAPAVTYSPVTEAAMPVPRKVIDFLAPATTKVGRWLGLIAKEQDPKATENLLKTQEELLKKNKGVKEITLVEEGADTAKEVKVATKDVESFQKIGAKISRINLAPEDIKILNEATNTYKINTDFIFEADSDEEIKAGVAAFKKIYNDAKVDRDISGTISEKIYAKLEKEAASSGDNDLIAAVTAFKKDNCLTKCK